MHRLILTLALIGCAHNKAPTPKPSSVTERLAAKYDGWEKELAALADKNTGWLSLTDCDGTLWTGEAVASGHPAQLVLAEWNAGQVHRRPQASGECWPKESAATVSPDMQTGYILGMFETKDLQALERLESYGEDHKWVMGQPVDSLEVFLSPAGAGLLARAAAKLGGASKEYGKIPEPCLPVVKDYEYHIQTLAILADGEISGSISDICLAALKSNAAQFPDDALMVAAYGVYTGTLDGAIALLLNDGYKCPSYVRPVPAYCAVHKAFTAKTILKRYGG